MILLTAIFAVLAAALAAEAARLTFKLKATRALLLAVAERPEAPPAPPPPRLIESRRERFGLLWFPVLMAKDEDKLVVAVSAGLPHCARCVRPLALRAQGKNEEWVCSGCDERRPGTAADLTVTDSVLTDCLREFFARHPDFDTAPDLSAPKFERAAV